LEEESLSTAERAEFVEWLRESPVHVAEILRVKHVHLALADFSAWDALNVSDSRELRDSVVPLNDGPERNEISSHQLPPGLFRRRRPFLAAASVLLIALVILFSLMPFGATTFATGSSERREIQLADGSTINLAPKTALRVRLSPALRSIQLEYGEALFHVAKDEHRPFIVDAASTSIRAVGTVFNVLENAETVVVAVTEGRVAVNPSARAGSKGGSSAATNIALAANQQIAIGPDGRAMPIHEFTAIGDRGVTVTPFSFEDETVADIVRHFNAVNRIKIRVLDSALAQRHITGVFNQTDPQSFVAFLEAAAGVGYIQRRNDEIDVGSGPDISINPATR
jgi:transmembrane sensor